MSGELTSGVKWSLLSYWWIVNKQGDIESKSKFISVGKIALNVMGEKVMDENPEKDECRCKVGMMHVLCELALDVT